MRKILVGIIICLMLLVPSVVSISINNTTQSKNGNILYVGGDGPGNYTSIQDAIDNASKGDTVFVFNESSPYYENIIIDTSINLIGENKNNTIINGSKNRIAVNVIADYVNISGFTIQYGKVLGIEINSEYNTIMNNIITEQAYGIKITKTSNNSIISNIFSNNYEAIKISNSNINTIQDNDISNNDWGVQLTNSQNIDISGNNISDNGNGIAVVISSNYNIIKDNNIQYNREKGIKISQSDRNNISYNNISNNENGIFLYEADNNSITNNNIKFNDEGLVIGCSTHNNIVFHNNFINKGRNANEGSSENIWDNGEYGNYWSDYREKYPFARKIWEKGIWDTPYEIPWGYNKDNYPLIKPWPYIKSKDLTGITKRYMLSKTETFTIQIQNKDTCNLKSDLGALKVTKPENMAIYNSLLFRSLERFPFLERLFNLR